jgi:hypothetical protein
MPHQRAASEDFDEDEDWDADGAHALPPSGKVRRRRLPWLRMTLMSGVAVFGLVLLAQEREAVEEVPAEGSVPAAILIAPPPPWQAISDPAPFYALEHPEGLPPPALAARRHASGGREDSLRFGAFGEPGHARLTLVRDIRERQPGSFYVDMVRRAAQAGLSVARSAQSRSLETKFGTVEAAPLVLQAAAEQSCLAFRFAHGELAFGFAGWLCGSDAKPVSEDQLACFIDRLSLAKGVEDAALKVYFAQAEQRRGHGCAPVARLQAPKVRSAARS